MIHTSYQFLLNSILELKKLKLSSNNVPILFSQNISY